MLVLIGAGTMVLQDRGDSSDSLVVPIAVLLVVSIGLAFGAALWAGLDKRRRTKFSTSRLFDERPYESAMKLVLERASRDCVVSFGRRSFVWQALSVVLVLT